MPSAKLRLALGLLAAAAIGAAVLLTRTPAVEPTRAGAATASAPSSASVRATADKPSAPEHESARSRPTRVSSTEAELVVPESNLDPAAESVRLIERQIERLDDAAATAEDDGRTEQAAAYRTRVSRLRERLARLNEDAGN